MQDVTCPTRSPQLRSFPCTKQLVTLYKTNCFSLTCHLSQPNLSYVIFYSFPVSQTDVIEPPGWSACPLAPALWYADCRSTVTASATFAQMGQIIDTHGRSEVSLTPNGQYQAPRPETITRSKGSKITDVGGISVSEGSAAGLKLTTNALILEKYTMSMSGDDMGPQTNEAWSIPLSGSVKELVFQPDGNLVVLDTSNKVLWSTGTGGRGDQLKFYGDGVLEIFDKSGVSIWRK